MNQMLLVVARKSLGSRLFLSSRVFSTRNLNSLSLFNKNLPQITSLQSRNLASDKSTQVNAPKTDAEKQQWERDDRYVKQFN